MNKKEDTSKRGRPKSPACICQLPPPAPPYTGGELITNRFSLLNSPVEIQTKRKCTLTVQDLDKNALLQCIFLYLCEKGT